jgi:hypothetical protein
MSEIVQAAALSTAIDWPTACARLLKSEIAREDITLAKLAARLQRLGVQESESSLKNKLYRGTFSMAFFVQCMRALGHSSVDVASVISSDVPSGRDLDKPPA